MRGATRAAAARLRAAPRRSLAAVAGIALAAAMAGAAVTVSYGLHTGFDRAARAAHLPDVIARFRAGRRSDADAVIRRLPDLAARAYRLEVRGVDLTSGLQEADNGAVEIVGPGARGYAIVAGRDVGARRGEVVVERGLARRWHLHVGSQVLVGRLGALRVVGIAISPDNVAYPLATVPHVYVDRRWVQRDVTGVPLPVNVALIWARSRAQLDVLLQQARATSFGLADLSFVTRSGVRVLVDQAAGIVIALLVGFSLVALAAAGVMLAAGAAAEVQRRLPSIGVQRALGVSRVAVAGEHALAAALVGTPAAAAGLTVGALVAGGPAGALLEALNEQPPGAALLGPLALALAAIVAVVTLCAAWPAWRAAGRGTVGLLRGGELAARAWRAPRIGTRGFAVLGARVALARRGRMLAAVAVVAVSGALVLLVLDLASLVGALRDDPGSVGKRYQLTAALPASDVPAVRAIPGVADAAPRYVAQGADSFALGEPVKLVAFGGDHTRFEDPPLASGRRLRGPREAEVGTGLAQALGLGVGGELGVQLASGAERRFRVVGTVRALDSDGRVAYVRPGPLVRALPGLRPLIAVRLRAGASRAGVAARLQALGATPAPVGGATTRNGGFLGTLATLLRVVAAINGLVCLYALVRTLALTAAERRPTLAVLRAAGAPAVTVGLVLAGAAAAVTVPAALLGLALERGVLAPAVTRLASSYADLPAGGAPARAVAVALALVLLGLVAAALVARRALAEPPVAGLGEEW